jgi:dihydroflavonol-4-reductase
VIPQLGRVRPAANTKAREVLGWRPRSSEEALLATAESLFQFGLAGGR